MRHIAIEDANIKAKNPQWQTLVPAGLSGKTLGLIGVGRLGSQTAKVRSIPTSRSFDGNQTDADRQSLQHESNRLVPESHARACL